MWHRNEAQGAQPDTGRPMRTVETSVGPVDCADTGGAGPVLVFLHGVAMSETVWGPVVAELEGTFRCVVPRLPLGAHRIGVERPDLMTHEGVAGLVVELCAALDLQNVVIVINDWGGLLLHLPGADSSRVRGLVITSCEAFENFPPGLPGAALAGAARFAWTFWLLAQLHRFTWFRRAPGGWGWMSKRGVDPALMDEWFRPMQTSPDVRRDVRAFVRSTPAREVLRRSAAALAGLALPTLVIWASEDKVMGRDTGRRLAGLLPHAELVEVPDAYTLLPLDQPLKTAQAIRQWLTDPTSLPEVHSKTY